MFNHILIYHIFTCGYNNKREHIPIVLLLLYVQFLPQLSDYLGGRSLRQIANKHTNTQCDKLTLIILILTLGISWEPPVINNDLQLVIMSMVFATSVSW